MTLEQLKTIGNDFIKAVKEYKDSNEYNEVELEIVIDNLLCDLPRDMIYVEWFDRSDIRNMADGIYDDPVNADTVDNCMQELWDFDNNMMDFDIAQSIISDTVRHEHIGEQTTCDFCGRKLHSNDYDNDGETIMCKTCQESGKFGHYNTNKGE